MSCVGVLILKGRQRLREFMWSNPLEVQLLEPAVCKQRDLRSISIRQQTLALCRHDVSTFSKQSVVMMSVHLAAVSISRAMQAWIITAVSPNITMPPWRNSLHPDKLSHLYIQPAFTCSLRHLLFKCVTGSRASSVKHHNAVTLQRPLEFYSHGNNAMTVGALWRYVVGPLFL